jgi:type II secretory pathway pseudopilin PulG
VNSRRTFKTRSGFTTIELLIVVSMIVILASLMQPVVKTLLKRTRDMRRVEDFGRTVTALTNYRLENNSYPVQFNGAMYVFSHEANFLNALVPKYLASKPRVPINTAPQSFDWFTKDSYYYAYYYYADPFSGGGGVYFGCGPVTFAVLGIRKFETVVKNPKKAYCGPPQPFTCPPWGIANVCRDWSLEFDYSTLLYDPL